MTGGASVRGWATYKTKHSHTVVAILIQQEINIHKNAAILDFTAVYVANGGAKRWQTQLQQCILFKQGVTIKKRDDYIQEAKYVLIIMGDNAIVNHVVKIYG